MSSLILKEHNGRPLYTHIETPEFHPSEQLKRIKYIEQERERITNGYEGLTGFHYFHLTKPLLHDASTGEVFNARFRMVDKKIIEFILWCKNHKLQQPDSPFDGDDHPVMVNGNTIPDPFDPVIIKPRQLALTSIIGSASMYFALTEPGISQALTSADSGRLTDLVNDKLFYAYDGCKKNGLFSEKKKWNSEFLQFNFNIKGQDVFSNLWLLDTAKDERSAMKVEGYRFKIIYVDERFLHNYVALVKRSSKDTLLNRHKNKVGIFFQGGSCNNMNKRSIEDLKILLSEIHAPESRTKLLFIEGWEGQVVDEYGFDNKELGIKKILDKRKALEKAKRYEDLANETKSYALSMKELISSVESGYYSPKLIFNLSQSKLEGFKNEPLECNLVYKNGSVYQSFTIVEDKSLILPTNKKFPYTIYEGYQRGHIYGLGGDPIDFTGANIKGSMCWMKVKDFTTNKYVCDCAFRTQDSELGYNLWWNLVQYYNIGKRMSMWEKNRLSSIITLAKERGTLDYIARDPNKKHLKNEEDVGYDKYTSDVLPKLMGYGRAYLENNIMPSITFADKFLNYSEDKNLIKDDEIDAFLSCEYLYNTIYRSPMEQDTYKKEKVFRVSRNPHTGQIERHIEEVTKLNRPI